jgi:SAM-dependent methyltransferase
MIEGEAVAHISEVQVEDDRIERERAFHNARFTEETREAQGKYYFAVKLGQAAFEARVRELAAGRDALEYGCGANAMAFGLAPIARSVTGIDISDVATRDASLAAAAQGLRNASFIAMNAEAMSFPDASFDLVYGRGIIHHLDLERAYAEIARVLRPGGEAIFMEPLGHNLLINSYRRLTPAARTVDEHPLLRQDFELARRFFGGVSTVHYGLTTLLSVPLRDTPPGEALLRITSALDRLLFTLPALRWQSWTCIMEMQRA